MWGIRILVALAIVGLGAVAVAAARASLKMSPTVGDSLAELVQGGVAAVNALLLMAGAVYFLWNLEVGVKRRAALRSLHKLRSITHIVDMHQPTKDPEQVLSHGFKTTASSPERRLTRFELSRYIAPPGGRDCANV